MRAWLLRLLKAPPERTTCYLLGCPGGDMECRVGDTINFETQSWAVGRDLLDRITREGHVQAVEGRPDVRFV